MARITMRNSQKATFAEVFEIYISAVTARGVKDKTIATYKQHFHAISKRLDVSLPINRLNSTVLDNMILQMRKEGLSDSSNAIFCISFGSIILIDLARGGVQNLIGCITIQIHKGIRIWDVSSILF